ncbi:MAG: hypothetical protein HPY65_01075 [Syntrophaceae bacterium]|nr:hypothetical protein [Syntrophaceae bacterium]
MSRRLLLAGLIVLTLFTAGCAAVGRTRDFRPIDPSSLSRITPGVTTGAEVIRLFGPPSQIVRLSNGNAYIYSSKLSKTTGLWLAIITFVNMDTRQDQVVFFLNSQDVVTHHGASFHTGEALYGLPF